jgi:type I restriction enzyme, S subunit
MNLARLGDYAEFLSGFAFKSKFFNDDGTGLPVVRIRDVVRGHSETFYSGQYDERYIVSRGEYLIGMDGEFNLARWQSKKALLNQRVCKIDAISDDLDRGYLSRFLPVALQEIEDATPFATVKHLSVKTLNEIQIPLPPLAEQKRIAKILGAADALRAMRRKSLAQLDILLQSTFLDMFGDPVTNPLGWTVSALGDECVEIRNGYSVKQRKGASGVPISRIETISEGIVNPERVGYADLELSAVAKHLLHPGDILFSHINSTKHLCKCAVYLRRYGPLVHGMNLLRFRTGPLLEPPYLLYLMKSVAFRATLMKHENRAVNQSSIAAGRLKTHPLPIPPLELQLRFSDFVESVEQQKVSQRVYLAELDALFASLQSRAFRGDL